MITQRTPIAISHDLDWCDLLGCIFVVLPGGLVGCCLRCGAPYPFTLPGAPLVVDAEDEEPFT